MHDAKKILPRFSALLIPFNGIRYFLSSPYLWWRPLAWSMIALLFVGALFFTLLLYLWPHAGKGELSYFIGGSEAIGYALIGTVIFWIFILPLPTAVFYEKMLKRVLHDHGENGSEERFLAGLFSSLKVIKGTVFQRIFWTFFPLFFLFIFPPLFTFLSFTGIGYITLIDAVDLSLSIQGIEGKERLIFLKGHRLTLWSGGVIAGILMFFTFFTLIGFLFLIPSLYVGSLLWIRIKID